MQLNDIIDNNFEDLSMDSLIIYKNNGQIIYEKKDDSIINIRSLSKIVMALACGILIDKKFDEFNTETYIYPILEKKFKITNKNNLKYLKNVKIKHLLTQTVGYRDIILMSKDITNFDKSTLVDYALNYPIYYKAGQHFLYSNAGYLLLSATMQEFIKGSLYEFINENIFEKLGIDKPEWEYYGDYIAGPTKLHLRSRDLLKIAQVISNQGVYDRQRIVSSNWISQMLVKRYKNVKDHPDRHLLDDSAYGYSIWFGKDNIYYGSGLGGQYIVFVDDYIIITTNRTDVNYHHKIKSQLDDIINIIRS